MFPGMNSGVLGAALARKLAVALGKYETTQFADGEIRVRILEEMKGKTAILVQSLYPKTNTSLMQLCFMSHTLMRLGASRIVAVIPYLGYARQDKAHRPGEAISSQFVAQMLETAGINRVVVGEIHETDVLHYFGIPSINVPILPVIAAHIIKTYLNTITKNVVLISPDQDGARRIKDVAAQLGVPYGFVQKERDLDAVDELKQTGGKDISIDVAGKAAILLDDMIATGSSLVVAAQKLKDRGAVRVFAGSTHGIFSKDPRMVFHDTTIERVVISDTLEQDVTFECLEKISCVDILAAALHPML